MKQQVASRTNPYLALGALAFALGCGWVALDSLGWYSSQQALSLSGRETLLAMVLRFYAAEGLAIAALVAGTYLSYRALRTPREGPGPLSVAAILSQALSSKKDFWIGSVAATIYAIVYLVISSVLVYQPGVDFRLAYGVTAVSWNAAACCGGPGTVPALTIYLAPQAHLALQVVPLSALFAVMVPILVGLNITVASYAVRSREVRTGTRWVSSIGVLVGLFTGCPTCAGLFLASAVGGLGTTTLAIALVPYQLLFVAISIPLLLVSPVIVAAAIRRSMLAACPIPSRGPD